MVKVFDKKIFGERFEMLILENNETFSQLAEYLELSVSTISRYVSGKMAPKHNLQDLH